MRNRCGHWKDRAYEYVVENGPCTSQQLLIGVLTKERHGEVGGRAFKMGVPRSPSHVFQVLKGDKRFSRKKVLIRGTTSKYEVLEWSVRDEE